LKDKFPYIEPFHIQTLDELRGEARRLKLDLPLSSNIAGLREPLAVGGWQLPNRLCVQPMEGCDADPGGAPGALTLRRYRRYAEGGFALIWLEAAAVDEPGRSHPGQLWISRRNVNAFAGVVRELRQCARQRWGHEIRIILQLAHAGRYSAPAGAAAPLIAWHDPALDLRQGIPAECPPVSDDYLDRLQDAMVAAGGLALEAGFDGVDLKACHGDLHAELLAATARPGRYGGSLENRSRFLREVSGRLRAAHPALLRASRLSLAPAPADAAESLTLVRTLAAAGVQLLNITDAGRSAELPDESAHPLQRFVQLSESTRIIQQSVPEIPVVAGGFSWFRHWLPNVAAGVLQNGGAALIGIGRAALAYPALAGDLFERGQLDPEACCLNCDACAQLIRDGGYAGCAVMDSAVYGAEYLRRRHFAVDNLRSEARRCRRCEPAPCRAGCPARIDVSAFLQAYAEDDMAEAYAVLRRSNALPGMCAHLCPVGSMCEGRCVAGILDGRPIPIHDIQDAVCWSARQSALTGVRVPELDTGKRVAIVGGGPASIACAVTLLELGHRIVIFERTTRLGGTPELAIRSSRFTGAADEVDAVLRPALRAARLVIRYGVELGREITLADLRRDHDAVFLAAGVWGEQSLGCAEGVVAGVQFLRSARERTLRRVPDRVILLAGGDSAMDCARVALEAGARELLIVYAGALSEMHWHMADGWFRTEGVHFLTLTRPLGFRRESDGRVSGLKIQRLLDPLPAEGAAAETILEATLIVEAMGLELEPSLKSALQGCALTGDGLLQTAGGESLACALPGVYAGGGMINGGASVVQCIAEGMRAGREMDIFLAEYPR